MNKNILLSILRRVLSEKSAKIYPLDEYSCLNREKTDFQKRLQSTDCPSLSGLTEDYKQTESSSTLEDDDPCHSIYQRIKEPDAYLIYQQFLATATTIQ